jgi:hypothetical protein
MKPRRWGSLKSQRAGTWRSYNAAKRRCRVPSTAYFNRYGRRGIKFCFASFQAFIEAVGLRPTPRHSIDRWPNNDGNYEKGNVRWATYKQQLRNRKLPVKPVVSLPTRYIRKGLTIWQKIRKFRKERNREES